MKKQTTVFLICPVARVSYETRVKIAAYVAGLEERGCRVHWPERDTNQEDATGGYEICKTNAEKILTADEVHIWYDETSGGSKFDMGVLFTRLVFTGPLCKIVLANETEVIDNTKKSFFKVMKQLQEKVHK